MVVFQLANKSVGPAGIKNRLYPNCLHLWPIELDNVARVISR